SRRASGRAAAAHPPAPVQATYVRPYRYGFPAARYPAAASRLSPRNTPPARPLYLCPASLPHFPLVKDIVLSECQFRMTLRFFLLINLTDKAVINLYFLLPESAFVFDRFMHYDFINHIVQ